MQVISSSQKPLPTQQTQETSIYALSGIRTRDPSNRAAADLRLRPHGQPETAPILKHASKRSIISPMLYVAVSRNKQNFSSIKYCRQIEVILLLLLSLLLLLLERF